MLRIVQNTQPAGAKSYYSTADYYAEGQELLGVWHGEAARQLKLGGQIRKEDWDALCDNRNPVTGGVLTQRQKEQRRVGYDFNFHVPKSISILYGLTRDDRILDAFRDSVGETMRDMEEEMKTRVRSGGRNEDRTSGNMVWGEFIHFTARPVDGIPDPHLHAHCFVFNTTWDEQEQRWKAGQFAGLKQDASYFEAVFHSRLARRVEELGLQVERTHTGWEVAGITKSSIDKFSRRTSLIEAKAKEKGITDAEARAELGAKTRERKAKNITLDELRQQWDGRLSSQERDAIHKVANRLGDPAIAEDERLVEEGVGRAVEHCFERASVVPERKVYAEALKRSVGKASVASVLSEFKTKNLISGEREGRRMMTTREVLDEEGRMIDFARNGRGTCSRLGDALYEIKRDWLNDGQCKAVRHILNSPDRVMLVRGAAGVGKTAMMQEAVEAIEASGKKVFTFAPSANASRCVLREDGFANAETVARLLVDEYLQKQVRGEVIWIDEAGLLGMRTMARVFDLADQADARIILSGDRRQHGSVERGAALRLLEEEAGLKSATIKDIQRQKGIYRQAVYALSDGRIADGFKRLDELGWIKQVDEEHRYKALAREYVETIKKGKSALVVSPTHREGDLCTAEIRTELKQVSRLGKDERQFRILRNANLTEADRADGVNYLPGDELIFHQNAKGYCKGERITVGEETLPLKEAARFQVYRPDVLSIASGDAIRMTRNGSTADGKHRLNNGAVFTVQKFDARGNIVLSNGWKISKDFGHLAHGYTATSHAAQGRTVDCVFIGQSSASFPASSREQFYVSASRGRQSAVVYTDDKEALLEAVSHSDERLSATEFMAHRERRERGSTLRRMEQITGPRRGLIPDKQIENERFIHER